MLRKFIRQPSTILVDAMYTLQKKLYLYRKDHSIILIAAFPRSACNFLSYLVAEALGYERGNLKPASGFFHDVIYLPRLIDVMQKKRVLTQHLRVTSLSRDLIKDLHIRPIVLVRNIFDVVISYDDYISKRGYGPLDPDQKDLAPEFCKAYPSFDDSKKYDYLIDTVVPWYISFYASWYYYTIISNKFDALWLTYKDLVTQPKSVLSQIFSFYNLTVPEERVDSLISKNKKVNYNKGISGRGDRLTNDQKGRIRDLTAYHPDVDFSMMGL